MEPLDLAIRTLFQEFQEIAVKRTILEKTLKDEGTITRKTVKGKEYWYRQRYSKGQAVQEYIGPSLENQKKILALKENQSERRRQIRQLIAQERSRIPLLRRAGLPILDVTTASLIEKLARLGLIYKGGVLVGSYAFASYAGMMGRLFEKESLKTLDVDVARDTFTKNKEISLIELVDPGGVITVREKRFYSVPGLTHKSPPSSFVGPQGLRIDFLAPLRGKAGGNILFPDIPDVSAQPIHFLDYLIKDPVEAILLGVRSGIVVTVPDPCRYAIHKLIVASRRPVTETHKRQKDISQATQLMITCNEERPDELRRFYQEAIRRGKGWRAAISRSLQALPQDVSRILS